MNDQQQHCVFYLDFLHSLLITTIITTVARHVNVQFADAVSLLELQKYSVVLAAAVRVGAQICNDYYFLILKQA